MCRGPGFQFFYLPKKNLLSAEQLLVAAGRLSRLWSQRLVESTGSCLMSFSMGSSPIRGGDNKSEGGLSAGGSSHGKLELYVPP
jgi:hypothetical protein